MLTVADSQNPQGDAPFGAYAPAGWRGRVIEATRGMPDNWLGKRLAFALRRIVLTGLAHPLDVDVFGARMRLMPRNNSCDKRLLFTPQMFDPGERALLAERARPDMVFVDVGANVGAYTMFAARLAGQRARIIAVEPLPAIFDQLVYNIAQNPGTAVKAIGCALADKDGELTLFVDAHNRGASSIKTIGWAGDAGQSVRVPARTLLGLVEEEGLERIDALKIDVGGAEDLVLTPFLRDAPDVLLPELAIVGNARRRWQSDCIAALKRRGYRTLLETRLKVVMERGDQPAKSSRRASETASSETSQP